MTRRPIIGYRQALDLLNSGEQMYWQSGGLARAIIQDKVIRYDAYRKLRKEGWRSVQETK